MFKRLTGLFMTKQMKNWQTTLAGVVTGLSMIAADVGITLPPAVETYLPILGVFAIAYFAKDGNKTGGSKSLTDEAKKRLE